MNLLLIFTCSMALMVFSCTAANAAPAPAAVDEIQVLIDVSGSMKQNDPQNQRVAATQLLINLLPDKSQTAIWLFAEKTTLLQQSNAVDANWKKQASKATNQIHANGLYTHIEDAIQTAMQQGFKGKGKKHLILLTDGIVDISKDIMVSADSRERILSEWIPKLQQQGIKVDTIALSDQADKELLYKLAFATGGWTETAASAEQLQKTFLKMLLKAAPKDSLPLLGNRFMVDSSVKEFSVLAFKKSKTAKSKLISPDAKTLDQNTTSTNVAWLNSADYDLITVKQPLIGEWRLEAEVDPDNQVMILTDLKMQMDDIPSFNNQTDAITLKVFFTEQDNLISKKDFLNLISINAKLDEQPAQNLTIPVNDSAFFSKSLTALSSGKHQIVIQADGKTFKREIVKEFNVVGEPLKTELTANTEKRSVTIKLLPDPAVIEQNSLSITAKISRPGKNLELLPITAKENTWSFAVTDLPADTETVVNYDVIAKDLTGKALAINLKPVSLSNQLFNPPTPEKPAEPDLTHQTHEQTQPEPTAPDTSAHNTDQTESADHAAAEPDNESTDWLAVGGMVLLVNLLLITGGFFIVRAMKKAKLAKQNELLARLS